MRIKIRIYNPYDLDIIALTEARNFSVPHAMRETLKYYAAGKRYLIEIPNLTDHLKNEKYVKGFYVELDDELDRQAIDFLKRVPDGMRNAFMKNIFRASFAVCPMSLYLGDGGSDYVKLMQNNAHYGKHPVQREIIDPVYLADGEIGVQLSETHEFSMNNMPKGEKPKSKPKTTPKKKPMSKEEALREATQNAFKNASIEAEKEIQARKQVLKKNEKLVTKEDSDDLDDLLDGIM